MTDPQELFRAYLDESEESSSGVYVVGGFVGKADVWALNENLVKCAFYATFCKSDEIGHWAGPGDRFRQTPHQPQRDRMRMPCVVHFLETFKVSLCRLALPPGRQASSGCRAMTAASKSCLYKLLTTSSLARSQPVRP
jgi:hypothetical protein